MKQYPKRRLVLFFVHKDVVMAGFLLLAYFCPCGYPHNVPDFPGAWAASGGRQGDGLACQVHAVLST